MVCLTPITSVVPGFMRKAVVNSRGYFRLIPFGRVSSVRSLAVCLKLEKE